MTEPLLVLVDEGSPQDLARVTSSAVRMIRAGFSREYAINEIWREAGTMIVGSTLAGEPESMQNRIRYSATIMATVVGILYNINERGN